MADLNIKVLTPSQKSIMAIYVAMKYAQVVERQRGTSQASNRYVGLMNDLDLDKHVTHEQWSLAIRTGANVGEVQRRCSDGK